MYWLKKRKLRQLTNQSKLIKSSSDPSFKGNQKVGTPPLFDCLFLNEVFGSESRAYSDRSGQVEAIESELRPSSAGAGKKSASESFP